MKIALSYPVCNRRGGVERIIYECARYLGNKGHKVTVYAGEFEKSGAPFKCRRVHVCQGLGFFQPLAFFRQCSRILEPSRYNALGTFGCVCPEGGIYWAQSVHAAWLEKAKTLRPAWSLSWWKQRVNPTHPILLKLEQRHFRKGGYRKVIALTEDVKSDLLRYYGVPENDVVVIPNGYSPEEFNVPAALELRGAVRRELRFGPDEKVIVFVANELERKGFPALLRAVESMRDSRLRLLVAGRMAPKHHPLVTYVGSTNEAVRYYAAADVFAMPTLYEAWGLVIIEAMATGLPVLTSRLAGAAVAVREGVTGNLLDDPTDEAEIAAKLRPLIEGIHASRKDISESVADYAWSRVLGHYEDVLFAHSR